MKTKFKGTFSIAVALATTLVALSASAGEYIKPGVNVKSIVAKELVSGQETRSGFAWDRHNMQSSPAKTKVADDASAFRWDNSTAQSEFASLSQSVYSSAPESSTQGFIWGIRNAAEQQGFIWGIRNAAEQQGFIWGIRNAAEQQGFIWGIRNAAEQQGFIWGIRNAAEQQGFIWGIRNAAEQQGFIWGIR